MSRTQSWVLIMNFPTVKAESTGVGQPLTGACGRESRNDDFWKIVIFRLRSSLPTVATSKHSPLCCGECYPATGSGPSVLLVGPRRIDPGSRRGSGSMKSRNNDFCHFWQKSFLLPATSPVTNTTRRRASTPRRGVDFDKSMIGETIVADFVGKWRRRLLKIIFRNFLKKFRERLHCQIPAMADRRQSDYCREVHDAQRHGFPNPWKFEKIQIFAGKNERSFFFKKKRSFSWRLGYLSRIPVQ